MLSNTLSKGIIILKIAMQAGVWVARVNNSGGRIQLLTISKTAQFALNHTAIYSVYKPIHICTL